MYTTQDFYGNSSRQQVPAGTPLVYSPEVMSAIAAGRIAPAAAQPKATVSIDITRIAIAVLLLIAAFWAYKMFFK